MIRHPADLTAAVLAVMQQTPDARLRGIMISLVTHLHAFVADTKLTEDEFRAACGLIAKMGQLTNDSHNEVVLMAGSLGVSSLVCLQNHTADSTHNLLGPFWRLNSPATQNGASIVRSPTPGAPLHVQAQVVDAAGAPVAGAQVDIWHCDATGLYENQPEARQKGHANMNLRGKFTTDAQGRFGFWSIKPVGYPIPTDGVVGPLLKAQQRHAMRPAHIHALVVKPGFKTLISQVYAHDDPNLASDVQFGVTETLTGQFIHHAGAPACKPELGGGWFSLDFVFKMEVGESKLPTAPIK
jgi:catechol 1,2-dioxygenase